MAFKRLMALVVAAALCLLCGCNLNDDSSGAVSSKNSVTSHIPSRSESTSSAPSSLFSSKTSSVASWWKPSSVASKVPSKVPSAASSNINSRPEGITTVNYLENIINDMTLPHEARPHGVPTSYNWSQKPREGYGVNMPKDWSAVLTWGQVYEAIEGNPATNTRVQLRNMQLYYFSKSEQRWIELQNTSNIKGNAYVENFKNNVNKAADQRTESASNGGGISVTAGDGYNYHFWPGTGRATIDPDDIAIIYASCQARLIVGNTSKPDDRASARYVLSVGGDYWYGKTGAWNDLKTNGDFAIGRFKYVTNEWQAFNGWAGDINLLRKNPPPMI